MLINISWLVYEHIEIIISLLLKEFVKRFYIKKPEWFVYLIEI